MGTNPVKFRRLLTARHNNKGNCEEQWRFSDESCALGSDMPRPNQSRADRRESTRFPIQRAISFTALTNRPRFVSGSGTTLNMSSSGILFTTENDLPAGLLVQVAVSWPVHLGDGCPLKLVAEGVVVRSEGGKAAVRLRRYEFRTQKRASAASAGVVHYPNGMPAHI